LDGTADRGGDAAAIIVRPGAVSGAAVGASAAGSAAVGVELEGKVKVEECPARIPQRGTRVRQSKAASRIGSGRRAPGRDQLPLCLPARAARSLAAADSPLEDQRSLIPDASRFSWCGPLGRKPRKRADGAIRRRAFTKPGGLERNDFSSNRHPALAFCWSMIFSENRYPLFGIMLKGNAFTKPRGVKTFRSPARQMCIA
jgi:hypothetical protein